MRKGDALTENELAMPVADFARANAGRRFWYGDELVTVVAVHVNGLSMAVRHLSEGAQCGMVARDTGYIPVVAWDQKRERVHLVTAAYLARAILEPGDPGYEAPEPCRQDSPLVGGGMFYRCSKPKGHADCHAELDPNGAGASWANIDEPIPAPLCHARGPNVNDRDWFVCTRGAGHYGDHASQRLDGTIDSRWPRATIYRAETATPTHQLGIAKCGAQTLSGVTCTEPAGHRSSLHVAHLRDGRVTWSDSWPPVVSGPGFNDGSPIPITAALDLIPAADAAYRYMAGQVHPGETTKGRHEREAIVRALGLALRTAKGMKGEG